MRIYLDSCIYQDLKLEGNKAFYNSVLESKHNQIYLFSEAHLYDLSRDTTGEKYIDMYFMESICEDNCLLSDANGARLLTPKEYYEMYNWDDTMKSEDVFKSEDPLAGLILDMFESVPLPFDSIFKSDMFSSKYPREFIDTMTKPSNLKEYMELMLKGSELMSEHSYFKSILQGGREVNPFEEYYKALGIIGFDGEKILDKEAFKQSYIDFMTKNYGLNKNKQSNNYNEFISIYMGLEILNIVKGKPKKQKFINLMNDGRHAYFGMGCDVVVSKDIDFISKTKFLYNLFDINTSVLSFDEFKNSSFLYEKNNFDGLINEVVNISNYLNTNQSIFENDNVLSVALTKLYIGYFNLLYIVHDIGQYCFIITKKVDEYKNKSLIKEINLVTNKLIDILGKDINGLGYFDRSEIIEGKWSGRTWYFDKKTMYLNYKNIIELSISENN